MASTHQHTLTPAEISGHGGTTQSARMLDGYSLEITTKDRERLLAARKSIPTNTFVSITFLPGDDVDLLADTAAYVRGLGLIPVPHIAARRISSATELRHFVSALSAKAAVDRVLIIAGDSPQPRGPFTNSSDILKMDLLARHGVKTIGIAGYPEGHPRIDVPTLWRALREKCVLITQQGLSAEIVTQFAFDATPVVQWIREVEAEGIQASIRVGVPGPASARTLLKFAAQCGVSASSKMLAKYGVSLTRLLTTSTPDRFIRDLASGLGASSRRARIHIYPFGGLERAAAWAHEIAVDEEEKR